MKLLVLASDPVGADDVRAAIDGDAARYREDDIVGEAERRFGVPVTKITR